MFSRLKPQLPVTSLKVGPKPCENSFLQANGPSKGFYPAELMKSANCAPDSRYQESGFQTNEETFMEENSLLGVLRSRSSYTNYEFGGSRLSRNVFETWNRPTWSWDISCEKSGKTRQDAYEAT